jgi:hypothetical protein
MYFFENYHRTPKKQQQKKQQQNIKAFMWHNLPDNKKRLSSLSCVILGMMFLTWFHFLYIDICFYCYTMLIHNIEINQTASVVEGLESMTSYPVNSLAGVRSPGDALVV